LLFSNSTSLGLLDVATIAYAVDLGSIFLVQAGLANLVLSENRKNVSRGQTGLHKEIVVRFQRVLIFEAIVGAADLASALPIFWTISTPIGPVRFLIWYFAFAMFFVVRGRRRKQKENKDVALARNMNSSSN